MTEIKALGSDTSRWIGATVRDQDVAGAQRGPQTLHAAMVARATGWVWHAASINAQAVASCQLRLFTKRAGRSSRSGDFKTRPVDRGRRRWLKSRGSLGPGQFVNKAVDMSDDVEEVVEHPILDLLRNGNEFDEGGEVYEQTILFRELTGNAYLHVTTDEAGQPTELWPMQPQHTRVIPDPEEFIAGYLYGRDERKVERFDPDEVIHFKHAKSPFDPYHGISWLRAVALEADIGQAARQSELATWQNQGRPDYAIRTDEPPTDEQIRQIESQLQQFRGPGNRGKWIILNGLGVEPLQFTPKEMEYLAGLDNVRDTIMTIAGVPKSMVTTDDVNRANAQEGREQHALNCALPRLIRTTDVLNARLVPLFDGAEAMFLACDNPVPSDVDAITTRSAALVGAGVITINEARRELDLEPVEDEEGDKLRVNGVPLDQVGAQAAQDPFGGLLLRSAEETETKQAEDEPRDPEREPPRLTPDQFRQAMELQARVQAGDIGVDAAVALLVTATALTDEEAEAILTPMEAPEEEEPPPDTDTTDETDPPEAPGGEAPAVPPAPPTPPEDDDEPPPDKMIKQSDLLGYGCAVVKGCACHKAEVAADSPFRDDAESAFLDAMIGFFEDQTTAIAERLRSGGVGDGFSLDSAKSITKNTSAWDAVLRDLIDGLTSGAIGKGAEDGIKMLERALGDAFSLDFDPGSASPAEFIRQHGVELAEAVREINSRTESFVADRIEDGLRRGLSTREIADAIESDLLGINRARAENIARSETARAYTAGNEASWSRSGAVEGKGWLLAPNACEFCQAMARDFAEANLGEPFLAKGSTLRGVDGGSLKLDHSAVKGPPLHPHDKCALVAILRDGGRTEPLVGFEGAVGDRRDS